MDFTYFKTICKNSPNSTTTSQTNPHLIKRLLLIIYTLVLLPQLMIGIFFLYGVWARNVSSSYSIFYLLFLCLFLITSFGLLAAFLDSHQMTFLFYVFHSTVVLPIFGLIFYKAAYNQILFTFYLLPMWFDGAFALFLLLLQFFLPLPKWICDRKGDENEEKEKVNGGSLSPSREPISTVSSV